VAQSFPVRFPSPPAPYCCWPKPRNRLILSSRTVQGAVLRGIRRTIFPVIFPSCSTAAQLPPWRAAFPPAPGRRLCGRSITDQVSRESPAQRKPVPRPLETIQSPSSRESGNTSITYGNFRDGDETFGIDSPSAGCALGNYYQDFGASRNGVGPSCAGRGATHGGLLKRNCGSEPNYCRRSGPNALEVSFYDAWRSRFHSSRRKTDDKHQIDTPSCGPAHTALR
jgi:hypothetical protein